ncbi:hypothetical protein A3N43_16830 [Klebsiella aerogenes]|uniref:hypothetical protein n=1 Tax=Klebsiella aerogenes TaxID=548 RepID=UPI0007B3D502|nr:hypothetical protein [Klebsiella aerogenes]KZQ44750.1 hypothetical protein A3N43_16830 [Klebsiella aerogenes]
MNFNLNKKCKTSTRIAGYGNVVNGSELDINLTFHDPDINTVMIEGPEGDGMATVHEVVFKVSCPGQIQGGFFTQLVKGMDGASKEDILEVAKSMTMQSNI